MRTTYVKESAPAWLLIDADGETLGRLASRVAHVLRGKHKAAFAHHQMLGDHVVIVNASKLAFTPNKFRRKEYISHTGRPGGFSRTPLQKLFEENPRGTRLGRTLAQLDMLIRGDREGGFFVMIGKKES